jgi:hypothetical protein
MAAGILAVGMAMIAMAFPVGVRLASIATERPVGVVAGNEAFAKIRLYSVDNSTPTNPTPNPNPRYALDYTLIPTSACMDLPTLQTTNGLRNCFLETLEPDNPVIATTINNMYERFYPSLVPMPDEHRYYWSPLLRRVLNTNEIQTTVFVCRMLGMGSKYFDMDAFPNNRDNDWPVPVRVRVRNSTIAPILPPPSTEIEIVIPAPLVYPPSGTEYRFFTKGCMIVEDSTGTIYRVMELKDKDNDAAGIRETLVLDKNFMSSVALPYVWVIPPAVGSSRNPCIDVVQTVLTF